MNVEKVFFGFFIILALTLNFSFVVGDIDVPHHHNLYVFFAVIVVNLLAMGLKLGDRSQIGALLLATSLVAVLQLVSAAVVWTTAVHVTGVGLVPRVMESIVSLAAGALLANIVSVVMLVVDSLRFGRQGG